MSSKNNWQEESRKHRDDGERRKKAAPIRHDNKVVPMHAGKEKRQRNNKWDQFDEDA